MIEITDKIKALNNNVNVLCGYNSNDIIRNIDSLNMSGSVLFGYRSSCGKTDNTIKIYRFWIKAVKEIEKQGITLKAENIIVGNSYATTKGGFWNEIRYSV